MITQGKWLISSGVLVCDEKVRIIANCMPLSMPGFDIPMEEAIDNARLIAAAPDLLEACKKILENMEQPAVLAQGDWQTGMFCGLEDRGITDRYDACMYGHEYALEKVWEWVISGLDEAIALAEKEQ